MARIYSIPRNRKTLLGTILLASTMLSGLPAQAQNVAMADTNTVNDAVGSKGLETVVVTAEKRSENLQKVPISVEVFGEQKLEDMHISNFRDLARYLPSVSYSAGGQGSSGAPGFATVSMRGVTNGNDGNHSGPQPTVGIYLDEQPMTTIGGAVDIPAYDIQRIEALAGPQGTLYGASSEAGTLRIITNKPDTTDFSAGYEVEGNSVAHGGLGQSVNGFVNLPITEKAAIRLVAWEEHDAGYIDNVYSERTYPSSGITVNNAEYAKKDYNTVDKLGGRAALKIDLNDNWTITPSIMGQRETSHGFFGYDPSVGTLEVSHYHPEVMRDNWYQAALTIEGKIANYDVVYSGGYMTRHVHTEADYNDYAYWYDTLAGWGYYYTDNSGNLVDPSQYIVANDGFTKFNNELRISSPKEDSFRWVFGLFQDRQTHSILQNYKIDDLGSDYSVTGWPGTVWLTDQMRVDRDQAVFVEASYDILPNLTFTAGVRGFHYKNSLVGFFGLAATMSSHTGEAGCFSDATVMKGAPCTDVDKSVKEYGETHKFNLTWHINEDKMVYATYSTGFRPGGVNRYGSLPPYKSDKLTNYEIGWKTSWLDDQVRWNGAAYIEDWKDFQFAFLGLNSLTQITNAGQAEVKGIESDISWLVTDSFTITGSGAYTDAKLTQVYCGSLTASGAADTSCTSAEASAPKGSALPTVPKLKMNLTGRYTFNLFGLASHLQGAMVYQSGSWPDLRTRATSPATGEEVNIRDLLGRMPGFATFDFGYGVQYDNISVELDVRNAFDKLGQIYRFAACTTQVCGNQPYITTVTPRTIALRIGQKF